MATYHVRFTGSYTNPGNLQAIAVELPEGIQLADLLNHLLDNTGALGRRADYGGRPLTEAFRILVNGRNAKLLGGEQVRLSGGDQVAILLPIAGGEVCLG